MSNKKYTTFLIAYAFVVLTISLIISCHDVYAGVSNGQPVSAAVTNAAFMDKNTTTTFTTAMADIQGGVEVSMVTDSSSTGSSQNITLTKPVTKFTNASLVSIQNLTIANRADATQIQIKNATGGNLTLKHLTGGTAAQQIDTGIGADMVLANNQSVDLFYNTVDSKWQVITSPATNATNISSGSLSNSRLSAQVVLTNQSNTFTSGPQSLGTQNLTVQVANDTGTGTANKLIAKYSGGKAIKIATTDRVGVLGIVVSGGGTSGSADIAVEGIATCTFDGATTQGDYVVTSAGTAGQCSDVGSTYPVSQQVLGIVMSTNGAGGDYNVLLFGQGLFQKIVAGNVTGNGNNQLLYSSSSAVPATWSSTPTISTLGFVNTGTVTVTASGSSGSYNFNLPIAAGSSGQVLTSQGGGSTAMTWSSALTNPMTTTGDIIYSSDNSGTAARLGIGSSTNYLAVSSGIPSWKAFTAHTTTVKTATGTQTGTKFTVSGVTTAPTNGATYTNNGHTYTVIQTTSDKLTIYTSGTGATSGSTLTKSGGTGDSTITFSTTANLASYTPPSTAKALWVRLAGGGGGGGGTASTSAGQSTASNGGGGGGYTEKLITSFDSTIYYEIGALGGGGSAGNNNGTAGGRTSFVDSQNLLYGNGGSGGGGSAAQSSAAVPNPAGQTGGSAVGGDLTITGQAGFFGFIFSAGFQEIGGSGGSTPLGLGAGQTAGTVGGNPASGYGGGGGGGCSNASQSAQAGGNGTAGVIDILELYNGN